MTEEKGLALWGGVELDLDIQRLSKKACACGAPAVVAVRKLDRQERTFLCESHRTAPSPPAQADEQDEEER